MTLSQRFDEACQAHAGQKRKGTDIPYISHLMGVAGIALKYGARRKRSLLKLKSESLAQDYLSDIRTRFGEAVS